MAAAPTLNVPSADDTMEISSDAGRADHDIDIDLMGDHGDDVDWMLQDAASERGDAQADGPDQSHNDDLMYDDGDEITYVDEETMQDDATDYNEAYTENVDLEIDFDPQPATEETLYNATEDAYVEPEQSHGQPEEETLIDFESFEEHDNDQASEQYPQQVDDGTESALPTDDTTHAVVGEQLPEHTDSAEAPFDSVGPNKTEAQGVPPAEDTIPPNQVDIEAHTEIHKEEVPATAQTPGLEASSRHDSPAVGQGKATDAIQQSSGDSNQHPVEEAPPPPELVSTKNSATSSTSVPPTYSSHPITVWFSDVEYSLFQHPSPEDAKPVLLLDNSVASSTLTDLFRACRSVLDHEVDEDVELEFYIESLNLTLSEVSFHLYIAYVLFAN